MNAIIVLPFLIAWAVGYVALLVATTFVVWRSVARRRAVGRTRSTPPEARWLSPSAVVLLICSALVSAGIVLLLGYSPQVDPDVAEAELVGTWVSATPEAPGEFTLGENGQSTVRGLTVLDQSVYWQAGSLQKLAEDLDSDGLWSLNSDNVHIELDGDDTTPRWTLLVTSSAFGGITLEAIVGDPDGPAFTQVFKRASD